MKFNIKKIHNIVNLSACAAILLAMLIPYASVLGVEVSLIDGDGVYVIMGLAVAVLFLVLQKRIPYIVFTVVQLVLCVLEIINLRSRNRNAFNLIRYEMGYYLHILGIIAMIVGAVLWWKEEKKSHMQIRINEPDDSEDFVDTDKQDTNNPVPSLEQESIGKVKKKRTGIILICILAAFILTGLGCFIYFKKDGNHDVQSVSNSTSDDNLNFQREGNDNKYVRSAILSLVKMYFDAKQRVDMEALAECVSDIRHLQRSRLVTDSEYIESYKNIDCTILSDGLPEGHYRVYVYYEAKIYDIDVLVPGLTAIYVIMDENGKLTISLDSVDEKTQKIMKKMDSSPEIKQQINSVQKKLDDIISKHDDVRKFYQILEEED